MKGAKIKQIMQRLDMTQQELADELGVARNTVNRWANDLEAIPKLAEVAIEAVELKRNDTRRIMSPEFLTNLRREITHRRKENHDERYKRRWNPEAIVTSFQTLLDWIEEQLDLVAAASKDQKKVRQHNRPQPARERRPEPN